jgi:Ca2+-binding EF-hand superfamily protein
LFWLCGYLWAPLFTEALIIGLGLQLFFYSTQAGFSIGFGDDAGECIETKDWTRVYTIIHVLIGSSLIVGALGIFVGKIIEERDAITEATEQETKENRGKARTEANRIKSKPCCATCAKNLCKSENVRLLKVTFIFLSYLGFGVGYGMIHLDWTFLRSLYFSIAALSTAGLQAPAEPVDEEDGLLFFLSLWLITGVPVFALTLGMLANAYINGNLKEDIAKQINAGLSKGEFEFAMKLAEDDDGEIDFSEFLQFKMLRLGFCSKEQLDAIRTQFKELDESGDGKLSKDEMAGAIYFDEYDSDHSGEIEKNEFVHLAKYLKMSPDKDVMAAQLNKLGNTLSRKDMIKDLIEETFDRLSGGDGHLSRSDFVKWYVVEGKTLMEKAQNDRKQRALTRNKTSAEEVPSSTSSPSTTPSKPANSTVSRAKTKTQKGNIQLKKTSKTSKTSRVSPSPSHD